MTFKLTWCTNCWLFCATIRHFLVHLVASIDGHCPFWPTAAVANKYSLSHMLRFTRHYKDMLQRTLMIGFKFRDVQAYYVCRFNTTSLQSYLKNKPVYFWPTVSQCTEECATFSLWIFDCSVCYYSYYFRQLSQQSWRRYVDILCNPLGSRKQGKVNHHSATTLAEVRSCLNVSFSVSFSVF